jgi:hypothetical protein
VKILPENGNSESILGLFSKLEDGKLGFFSWVVIQLGFFWD